MPIRVLVVLNIFQQVPIYNIFIHKLLFENRFEYVSINNRPDIFYVLERINEMKY